MSSSGQFLFSSIFSFPRHISRPTRSVSHLPHFQFSCHIPGPIVCIYHFSCFSIFLIIFHYLKSVILIFRNFHFSRHIPGPTMCIFHFSRLLVISLFFKSSSVCFSFSMISSFLAIFHVLELPLSFSSFFSFPRHISHPTVCVSHFPQNQLSSHIPCPTVCFSHFSRFSVISSFFKSSMCVFIFHDFHFS